MYLSFGTSGKRRSHHGCEWGGHSMGHLPPHAEDRERGTLKVPLFSGMLGEQPDLFSSLGREPSRNFPHNHNDDPSNEADG